MSVESGLKDVNIDRSRQSRRSSDTLDRVCRLLYQ